MNCFIEYRGGELASDKERRAVEESARYYREIFPFLSQQEAETLYLLRFSDEGLGAVLDMARRYMPIHTGFEAPLAEYVSYCLRECPAFALPYTESSGQFQKYREAVQVLKLNQLDIRIETPGGCLSNTLGRIANLPLKPRVAGGKRILHYVPIFSLPTETFIYDLVKRLDTETDHDSIVLCKRTELPKQRPFTKKIRLNLKESGLSSGSLSSETSQVVYQYLVKQCEIDLLIVHFAVNACALRHLAAVNEIELPMLLMTHGYDVRALKTPSDCTSYVIDQLAVRDNVLFTSVSKYLAGELASAGVPAEKITVLYNTINDHFFHHRKTDDFYDGKRPLRLLNIGRLIGVKGHRFLLEALARFRQECTKNVQLTIVYGKTGDELDTLRAQAENLKLTDCVIFEPFVDFAANPDYISRHDIYVHCSTTHTEGGVRQGEAFGVSVLEAIASGIAVIASDAGGTPEVVGYDTPHSRIVPSGSAEALFHALADMYATPETFTDNLSYAEERLAAFSPERQLAGINQLIDRLTDNRFRCNGG